MTRLMLERGSARVALLVLTTSLLAAAPAENYAANLGITYEFVSYNGALGARLTKPPEPGSVAANLRFEVGDIIVKLDERPITGVTEVLRHYDETTIAVVDINTGKEMSFKAILPRNTAGPEGLRVSPTPGPAIPPNGPADGPGNAGLTQPELRVLVRDELLSRRTPYEQPQFRQEGRIYYWKLGGPDLNFFHASPAVYAQFQVEIIRLTRNQPAQRAFWQPYLQRIEQRIAELLARGPVVKREKVLTGGGDADDAPDAPDKPGDEPEIDLDDFFLMPDETVSRIFAEAMQASAASVGLIARPEPPRPQRGIYPVVLLTRGNQGRVFIMPSFPYKIRASKNRMIPLDQFDEVKPGKELLLSGEWVYAVFADAPPRAVDTQSQSMNPAPTINVRKPSPAASGPQRFELR